MVVEGGVRIMLAEPSVCGEGRTVLRTEVELKAVSGCMLKFVVVGVGSWNIAKARVIDAIHAEAWAL